MAKTIFSTKAKLDHFDNYTFILLSSANLTSWILIFWKKKSFLHHFTKEILPGLRFLLNSQQVKLDGFGSFHAGR